MQQLSPKDAWFVYVDSPRFRQAFVSAHLFLPDDGSGRLPDRGQITRWFEERTVLPALRRRLVRVPLDLDHPCWATDPDFAVSRHLHFHDPMSWDDFRAFIADISTVPMDPTRPLWEIHVVDRVDGAPGVGAPATGVAVKMHHAMTDGIGSNELMAAIFGETLPAAEVAVPVERVRGRPELVVRALAHAPRAAAEFVRAARQAQRNLGAQQAERQGNTYPLPPQRRTPTPLDGPVGPRRVLEIEYFSLRELQALKAGLGDVTVNDLMLTVIGGAMRAYLLEQGETLPGSLAASVPMTIRSTAADRAANNLFVMMTVNLHTDLTDPIERIRAVHGSVLDERRRMAVPAEVAVADPQFMVPGWMFRIARRVQAWKARSGETDVVQGRPFNTFVSSVPRDDNEMRLLNTRDVRSLGIGPLDGTGTGHSMGAMGDALGLNIFADPELLRDPARYTEIIRESYEQLRDAVSERALT